MCIIRAITAVYVPLTIEEIVIVMINTPKRTD